MRMFSADRNTDYNTAEEAIAAVEAKGSGSVVLFNGSYNRPGCEPKIVYNSCAMWIFKDGKWFTYSIHGGTAEKLHEEKPH